MSKLTKEKAIEIIIESVKPDKNIPKYCSWECEYMDELGKCVLGGEEVLVTDEDDEFMSRTALCLILKPVEEAQWKLK